MLHIHDYDLLFFDSGFTNELRCQCGDIAPSIEAALRRTRWSMVRYAVTVLVSIVSAMLLMVGLAALVVLL